LAFLLLVVASCSGAGGCSSGCGLTPLPAGFPEANVIQNAASARLTRPGLDIVSANLGNIATAALGTAGGTVQFSIPSGSTSISVFGIDACKGASSGQCLADIGLGGADLHLDAVSPSTLSISGTVPVEIDDVPVLASGPFGTSLTFQIGIGQGGCQGSAPKVTSTPVPVTIAIPLVAEEAAPRTGYTKLDGASASISANIDPNTIQICGSGISGLFAGILSNFKSFILGLVQSPLEGALKSAFAKQLCEKPSAMASPACPTGTQPSSDGSQCVFSSGPEAGQCVPLLLGLDGHFDVGSLFSTITPGASGGIDFVLAAGGNADASPDCKAGQTWSASGGCATDPKPPYAGRTPNGLTLGLLGGALPSPQSSCVPAAANPAPEGIPIPDELRTDAVTPWPSGDPGPDFGLALAGRFLNYAAGSAYGSGALCLGVTTEQEQALSTGLLSAIIPSIKNLTFEPGTSSAAAAMAVTTRPQKPPVITIGNGKDLKTDPLLTVLLPSFSVDFYVWSYDRYVRIFTYTADLTIPLDLQTGKDPTTNPNGGVLPVLGDVTAANASVTNAELLTEGPQQLSAAMTSLLSGLVGRFLGKGFTPFDLSSAFSKYGLRLTIPDGGFRKLTKGTDEYLALFGGLSSASSASTLSVHPQATIAALTVHPEAMSLATATRAALPQLQLRMSAPEDDGTRPVEYSFWVDDQPHSAWQTSHDAVASSQYLFFQGKHVLHVTARVAGRPETEGPAPAAVPFVIDVLPPSVWLERTDKGYAGRAYDFVSDLTALRARYRGAEGAWSEWQPLSSLQVFESAPVDLQVKDEAGNVGEANGLAQGAAASSACSCSTPGRSRTSGAGLAAMVAAIASALLARRRRATVVALGSMGVVAAVTPGCSCSSSNGNGGGPTGCGTDCNQPCGPPNQLGLIGSYTSYAAASDGTLWVAGYNDADVTNGYLYGDLVVGKVDPSTRQVAWQTVDGLPPPPPAGSCPPNPKDTWRNGLTDPGPDVGLWTSIQLDSNGNPMVSYYDATNAALKFASSADGGRTWAAHTVMQATSSDTGRYSKMLVLDGVVTIAFLVIEPGSGGWARSRVALATAKVASPQSASDWSFQDAVVDQQTPCRAQFCGAGQVCVTATMVCQPTVSGCTPSDCGASTAGLGSSPQACVTISGAPTCEVIDGSSYIDSLPDADGDYITMAGGPNGVGLIVYDRTRGNLVGAVSQGGSWQAFILDGQTGANGDPTGIGASLAITSEGDWHVSYVNGWTKSLQYLRVPAGNLNRPLAPEVVDDGTQVGDQPFPDGTHLVGDDPSVTVDGVTIRIVYQDASAGTLREAIGAPGMGQKHTWTLKAISQPSKFAGFFPHYVPEAESIENWYRATDTTQSPPLVTGNVAFVLP
jgi:hypothetical protein